VTGAEHSADEQVRGIRVSVDTLTVALMNGRSIVVPLVWFPRLLGASPEQRARWEPAGAGYGIHWPDLAEDLGAESLLRGAPAASGRRQLVNADHSSVQSDVPHDAA
jgi:hypothetical protein